MIKKAIPYAVIVALLIPYIPNAIKYENRVVYLLIWYTVLSAVLIATLKLSKHIGWGNMGILALWALFVTTAAGIVIIHCILWYYPWGYEMRYALININYYILAASVPINYLAYLIFFRLWKQKPRYMLMFPVSFVGFFIAYAIEMYIAYF